MIYFRLHWFFLCLALLTFFSCSSEKSPDKEVQKPIGDITTPEQPQPSAVLESNPYSLEITPVDASRKSTLQIIAQGFKLSDAKTMLLVNGQPLKSPVSHQLNAKDTRRGDRVQVRALVDGKEILSNTIEIRNTPPELTRVKIMPEIFKPGDSLYIEASGNDIDGDTVIIGYDWTKNGAPSGNTNRLEVPLKRGDKLSVKVTPFDGAAYGSPVILTREIKNMPPMITEHKKLDFDGKIYTYQIKAADPDGDTLAYDLKQAPKGMVIDKAGLVTWEPAEKVEGVYPVIIQVTDGYGGEATYNFSITTGFR